MSEGFDLDKFVDSFSALVESEGGADRLRRLVLELAVRGLLVPPDLAVARAKVALATASGAGRRARSRDVELPALEAEEQPFPIPANWVWGRVNDTGEYINGLAFKPSDWGDSGYPIIRIQNLTDPNKPIHRTDKSFEDAYIVRTGDLLVSWSATLDVFIWEREPGVLNQHIFRVLPNERVVLPRFLYHALRYCIRDMEEGEHAHGLVMKHINRGPFLAHPLPLPPLAEQHRIVAKVDELMRLIDDLEAKQAKKRDVQVLLRTSALDALTHAEGPEKLATAWKRLADNFEVLLERAEAVAGLRRAVVELAVRGRLNTQSPSDEPVTTLWSRIEREREALLEGRRRGGRGKDVEADGPAMEPYPLPPGWLWCRLADVAGHIVDGTHHTPTYVADGVAFISAKDIRDGRMSFDKCKYITAAEFTELATRCRPKRGDVLVQKSGSIGEVAVVDTDRTFTLFESVALVPPVASVDPRYVAHVAYLGASGQFGKDNKKGVGVTHLHLVDLRRLPFPLPPLNEQKRIVVKIEALMTLCDDLEARLKAKEATAKRLVEAVVAELVA